MIEQIKTFKTNAIALEVIDSFTETDEKIAQKFFNEKIASGFKTVNILVKINQYKIVKTEPKALVEDLIFIFKKFDNIGNIAIVGHSKTWEKLVPIDNFFFEKLKKGKKERYFDISQLDKAFEFITSS